MEQQQSQPTFEDIPGTNESLSSVAKKPNDGGDSNDDDEMPTLETIEKEMNSMPNNKKNIVIPKDSDDDNDNNGDGYMDILNNGDLRKKILKKGDEKIRPQRGSKVVIRLETRIYCDGDDDQDVGKGKLIEAETFPRLTLDLGDNDLHQGLDLIIPLMELHEVCRAIIKPRFAYGSAGNKNIGIPENSTLDLTIELLEIISPNDNPYNDDDDESISKKTSLEDRIKTGNYKKTRGNFWFEREEYSMAIQCYRGALKYLDASQDELKILDKNKEKKDDQENKEMIDKIEELIERRAQTFNNLAAAQMKLKAFDLAMRSVEESLLLRPNNIKALYRHAKIHVEKGNIEEAIEDLKKASSIDPQSESVQMELDRLNKVMAKQLRDQKELYRRMMQVKNDGPNKSNTNNSHPSKRNSNDDNCDNSTLKSIWSLIRWPAISLGAVTAAAFLIQLLYSPQSK